MSPSDAHSILGEPEIQEDLEAGQRWKFLDDGAKATSGWTCIVDFTREDGSLRLSYFLNVEHVIFTNSLRREFGRPLNRGNLFRMQRPALNNQ